MGCLQLLVELSQRHAQITKTFEGNIYLLRYLSQAPGESGEAEDEEEEAAVAAAIAAAMEKQSAPKGKKRVSFEEASNENVEPIAEEKQFADVKTAKPKRKKK